MNCICVQETEMKYMKEMTFLSLAVATALSAITLTTEMQRSFTVQINHLTAAEKKQKRTVLLAVAVKRKCHHKKHQKCFTPVIQIGLILNF